MQCAVEDVTSLLWNMLCTVNITVLEGKLLPIVAVWRARASNQAFNKSVIPAVRSSFYYILFTYL